MPALRLTVNAAVDSPNALETWTFPDFRSLFKAVEAAAGPGEKTDSDLLVPVAEWSQLYREDANARTMARVFLGDVDGMTDVEVDTLVAGLEGLSCIVYTTHSHRQPRKNGLSCYRVILELDREYPPALHGSLWDAVNSRLSGLLDPSTRKVSLGHYLPSYPASAGTQAEICMQEGVPFQVPGGAAPSAVTPYTGTAEGAPPTLAALENVLAGWARQGKDAERRAAAVAARELLRERNTVALHQGRRNAFLTSLAGYLAAWFPTAGGISNLFLGVGWDHFNADGKYPLETFQELIDRFQGKEREAQAATAAVKAEEQGRVIAAAMGEGRTFTVTEEEVCHLREVFCGNWQQHLLAQRKRDIYLLRPDGTYDPDPVVRDVLFLAAQDRLAVFGDHVEYTYEDDRGRHRKTEKGFLEEYGHLARAVVYDMGRPRGGYDADTETVFLPAAAPIVLPIEHPDVHEWLSALDDHLLDMLSMVPRLTKMLPALVLTGPGNCGKTLLALGVGQIYGRAPADGDAALDRFNALTLTKMPVVFMDEQTAEAYRKEGTTLVRKFVTCGVRMLDEKYQARVELLGYPRLIVAANNIDVMNTDQDMSTEDREAFAERLVHIDMVAGMPILEHFADRIQEHWLDGRRLAEHVFWLSQNWELRHPGRRFAVASNHTPLHDGLASKSGAASDVACWLLNYVSSPERAKHLPIDFSDGRLRVNTGALIQGWGVYLNAHRPPSPSKISRALKSLSRKARQKITFVDRGAQKRIDAYEIDSLLLRSANDIHGLVADFDRTFNLTGPVK